MAGMSNRKGKDGERAVARIYREHGIDSVRTPLSGGLRWKGDLIGVPGVHVEVKRCERAQIWDWIKQAERDCPRGDIPAVHFKRNRSQWYVAVPLEDFINLLTRDTQNDAATDDKAATEPVRNGQSEKARADANHEKDEQNEQAEAT